MVRNLKAHGLAGEMAAEFVGTMILILFGCGVVAQVAAAGIGDHDSIAWAWGIGVTLGVYVASRVSGAHLNPAITVALAVFKGFSWRKVAPYALAQTAYVRRRHAGALELHRGPERQGPRPDDQDPGGVLHPAGQRHAPGG